MTSAIIQKDEIVQQEILQAALQLFQKYGLYKVTMDDVAKAVGKGRSSLYYYYKNRDEIFEAVLTTFIQEIIVEITQGVQEAKNVKQQIQALCKAKLHASEKRRAIYRALESGIGAEDTSKHTTIMNSFHNQLVKQETIILKQIIIQGMRNGEIRALNKKEMDIFIFLVLSGIRGIKRELSLEENTFKTDEVVICWTDIVFKHIEI